MTIVFSVLLFGADNLPLVTVPKSILALSNYENDKSTWESDEQENSDKYEKFCRFSYLWSIRRGAHCNRWCIKCWWIYEIASNVIDFRFAHFHHQRIIIRQKYFNINIRWRTTARRWKINRNQVVTVITLKAQEIVKKKIDLSKKNDSITDASDDWWVASSNFHITNSDVCILWLNLMYHLKKKSELFFYC